MKNFEIIKNSALQPRAYANVNKKKPKEYYDYENYEFQQKILIKRLGDIDNYEYLDQIGKGKYSEVFEGINLKTNKKVIIKQLLPIKQAKINREACILERLKNCENIVQLNEVAIDWETDFPCFIFDQINKCDFRHYISDLSDLEVRYYMFQVLKALDECHSRGIMHRDVKPHNIVIDPNEKKLNLIDWVFFELTRDWQNFTTTNKTTMSELLADTTRDLNYLLIIFIMTIHQIFGVSEL